MDGRPRPVCPACGRVAYQQLKVGAGVLVEREGALLLVQRGPEGDAFPGTWNLPAGYCEVDEAPPVTAVREAAEETGFQVQAGRLVDAYFFNDDPRGNGVLLVYEAEIVGGELRHDNWSPENPAEVTATGFFPPDRLPEPLCGGGHDHAIEAWRRRAIEAWRRPAIEAVQRRAVDRWQPGTPPRFCPHCAHSLEERMAFDRLRRVCPTCGFVDFRDPKVGVSVLVERDGQVLLVRRAVDPRKGTWCLPSGFVEWDEAPDAAAARECLEETGLVVESLELLEVTHYTDDFRGAGINLAYRARVTGGTLQPGDDAQAARWFAPADLPPPEMIAFGGHRDLLEQRRRN